MSASEKPIAADVASTDVAPPSSPGSRAAPAPTDVPPSPPGPGAAPIDVPPCPPVPGAAPTAAGRLVAGLSALVFVGSVLSFIWFIQPLRRPVLTAACLLAIVLLAVAINLRAGESASEVGFRVDNFGRAARLAAAPTLVLALLIVGGALLLHGRLHARALLIGGLLYPLWGFTQQYALQGIVWRQVRRAGLGAWAGLVAAGLFALVHAPNPGLMLMTFVGGCVWCELYRRAPNLFVLGISHGLLATLLLALLPLGVTGGLRIGPDYLRFHAARAAHAHSARPATGGQAGLRPPLAAGAATPARSR
jgi:membrane protease YdiL (CAAX protease family)